jgi:superfamily II DNA or RNA helicase
MACYIYKHPDLKDASIYKIGKANDVVSRHANLSTSYVNDIKEKWYIYPELSANYTSGMLIFIEKTAHKLFAKSRINEKREFFQFENINSILEVLVNHLNKIGVYVRLTREVSELPDIKDFRIDDNEQVIHVKETTIYKPKEHQKDILEKLSIWYDSIEESGKLILPPGIGKSYITGFHICKHQIKHILVLVPLKVIAEDFAEALRLCHCHNIRQIYSDTDTYISKSSLLDNQYIYVVVYDSAKNNYKRLNRVNFDLIVYDEAHHMCAEGNKELMKLQSKKKLYLTATPRIIIDSEKNNVVDMNNKHFGKTIYEMKVIEAIEKGLLCDYKIYLAEWEDKNNITKNMITELKEDYGRKKIIIFSNTVERSKLVCKQLNELGFPTSHVDGESSKNERYTIKKIFEEDEFHIICNVGVIGEGANIPCIDTVIFADDRTSDLGVIQNIGRGLRITKDKDFCMVIVSATMIKEKFLANLMTYDQRISVNVKQMVLKQVRGGKQANLENVEYSVEGIVNLVEKYNSKLMTNLQIFIRKLRNLKIYTEKQYRENFKDLYTDEFPIWPEEQYYGFKWSLVKERKLEDSKESYESIEELRKAINKIIEDKIVLQEIDKLTNEIDKNTYLHSIDSKIPLNDLTKKYNIKSYSQIHYVFSKKYT